MTARATPYPQRFGPYVLLERLGRGGMGQVALAMTGARGLESLFVIKRILPNLLADREYRQRFRDEAGLVRRLAHANLVRTFAVGEESGEPYIAQEFVEGHDLSEVLRRAAIDSTAIPIEISVYIIREIARGLGYAHAFEKLRLVHRDINPVNIRLTYEGDVKLLDFGLATSTEKTVLTDPNAKWGKFAYMAPEQLTDQTIDGRADIYTLGILLWELVTDRPLWPTVKDGKAVLPQGDRAAMIERMLRGEVTPPSALNATISPELDRVVLRALARAPEERYQTANELRAALRPFLPINEDADTRLGSFLTGLFDVEKEREARRALVASAWTALDAVPEPGTVPTTTPRPKQSTPSRKRMVVSAIGLVAAAAVIGAAATRSLGSRRPEPVPTPAEAPAPAPRLVPAAPPPVAVTPEPAAPPESESPAQVEHVTARKAAAPSAPSTLPPRTSPEQLLAQATTAYQRGQFERAIQVARAAIRDGAGAPAQLVLGNANLSLRNLDEAERAYTAVLASSPHDQRTIELLALVRELRKAGGKTPP